VGAQASWTSSTRRGANIYIYNIIYIYIYIYNMMGGGAAFDTAFLDQKYSARGEEWCIRDPARIINRQIYN
jgi:hypothetical protein